MSANGQCGSIHCNQLLAALARTEVIHLHRWGYRPHSARRSRHHHARALDLRVEGVPNAELRDVAVGLARTGVGFYPHSTFVHVDVRAESAYWVDLSGPGEPARYVRGATPPEPAPDAAPPATATPAGPADQESPPLDVDALRARTDALLEGLVVPAPCEP